MLHEAKLPFCETWTPRINYLLIPSLRDMEATGRYDREVLLWLQEAQVSDELNQIEDSDAWCVQAAPIFKARQEDLARLGIPDYLKAFDAFYQAAVERHLENVDRCIETAKQREEGSQDAFLKHDACVFYLNWAKAASGVDQLSSSRTMDQAALKALEARLKHSFETVVAMPHGDDLMMMVDSITANPNAYLVKSEGATLGSEYSDWAP